MDGDEDGTLAEAFWTVSRRLRGVWRDTLAPWDVTPSQARALAMLVRHGAMRPGALAEHLRIAARSATGVVDDLEGRGLVRRAPDPGDRRATVVSVTDEGERVATAIRATRDDRVDRIFASLDGADRAELARLLRTLAASADGAADDEVSRRAGRS